MNSHITVHLHDGRSRHALEGVRLDDVFRTPGLTVHDVYAYEKDGRCKLMGLPAHVDPRMPEVAMLVVSPPDQG